MKKRKRLKRWLVLCFIFALFVCGTTWQPVSIHIEQKNYLPIGEFADLDSYKAHYVSKGNGDCVFVFITGSGTPCAYSDFYKLQNLLATIGQTVTFDHAGSGWSETTDTARTIENLRNELDTLIETVAPGKPVILLCHSLGSLEAISYAQTNPKKVKGIIFLDSGSPEFYAKDSKLKAKILNRSSAFIRTTGINRLLFNLGIVLPLYGENVRAQNIPLEVKSIDRIMYYRHTGNPVSLNTIKLMNENGQKVLAGPDLGKIPILLLSSDSGREWTDVQIQLAAWSKNSQQVTIPNSEHYIYWSNYEEVAEYIMSFITNEHLASK